MTTEQKAAMVTANKCLKKAWPDENLQICFNLSKKHTNVNYNMEGTWKQSGIINPGKATKAGHDKI